MNGRDTEPSAIAEEPHRIYSWEDVSWNRKEKEIEKWTDENMKDKRKFRTVLKSILANSYVLDKAKNDMARLLAIMNEREERRHKAFFKTVLKETKNAKK